ncbi:sec-independent protein translocase protein TATB, chloroplastic [Macadamia integrifolia]|uniref:sec-independent protein translocase protein TATB, chloroplastic n=1 Tax=Macadamia integrifolia TaxID=60698 RepID=UPI001C4EF52F|nr:sec-independent protein translocase protein TATB, chloroplastic [Macadamia integrifolia]
MASITSTAAYLCSSTHGRSPIFAFSASVVLSPQNSNPRLSTSIPQLGFGLFPPWNGLKHLGLSVRPKPLKIGVNRRSRGKLVYASLFGVGAPEALVIGVVALLVFGPKGLAEVARNLGKTLRAFQPTIRELQEVSKEFKSTLEREIGLDDIPTQNTNSSSNTNTTFTSTSSSYADKENAEAMTDPNGAPSAERAYTAEDYLKVTEMQLKASAAQQQGQTPLVGGQSEDSEPKDQAQALTPEVATTTPPQSSKKET